MVRLRRSSNAKKTKHFDYLTDEILVEILCRLPMKYATQCKCVSKRWFALISSTYFAQCYTSHRLKCVPVFALFYQNRRSNSVCKIVRPDHMKIPLSYESLLLKSRGFKLNYFPFALTSRKRIGKLLAASNGLILCCSTLIFQMKYRVLNPLTKQWLALPPPTHCVMNVHIGFMSTTYYGKTISTRRSRNTSTAATITSFKVVRFPACDIHERDTINAEIFSSESGKWMDYVVSLKGSNVVPAKNNHGLFCNCILYCLKLNGSSVIVAYDPYNDITRAQVIHLPQNCNRFASKHVGWCKGKIKVAQFSASNIRIWELNDYEKSKWSLEHMVLFKEMASKGTEIAEVYNSSCGKRTLSILAFHPFDSDVLFLRISGLIVMCNMRRKILRTVSYLSENEEDWCDEFSWTKAFLFVLPWWPNRVPSLKRKAPH